eukprot:UN11439
MQSIREINSLSSNSSGCNQQKKRKRNKKRTFNEMNVNDDGECKDNMDELCYKMNKKMKIWDSTNDKSLPYLAKHENKANDNTDNDDTDSTATLTELQLIPSIIQYAQFMNNDNAFVTKLCQRDSMQRMKLNKYTGAVVKYVKPERKSWKELIRRYYENNKQCDVENVNMEKMDDDDFEMNHGNGRNKKNKRPIRVHPSYTGFNKNHFISSDLLKK